MENNIFRDVTTQLDLNGPILSWTQEPTVESLTFDVTPDLPDGTDTFTLSGDKGSDNFTSFVADKLYTLIPRGTFTSTITLKGAAGGSDSALDYGGLGGAVKGTVKFEKGVTYRLVIGKEGPFVDDVINSGGEGEGGTAYGGDDIGTGIRASAGAGGGFTGLFRLSVSQANALLVAGGGGGAAENQSGGNGGGSVGDGAGTDATSSGSNTSGGKGASLTAGGAAGIGDNLQVGDPGSALQGGSTGTNNPKYPGSAGGGGYWGGGSGAGVDLGSVPNTTDKGGGGGGGSSYYSSDTTKVTNGSYETVDNTGGGTASFSVGQGASVILSGIASATFPTAADNSGTIAYQWYEDSTALTDTAKFVGTATTTFTILDLVSPTDNGREFTLHVDYVPSTSYETGNAINEPLISGISTITTLPSIEIIAEPSSVQALLLQNGSISIDSTLTDTSYASDLTYQWILNGEDVTDGTKTIIISTSTTVPSPVEVDFFSPGSHTVPADATNVVVTLAGAAGGRGGSDAGGPGGNGGKGRQGRLFLFGGEERGLEFRVGRKGNDGTSGGRSAGGSKGKGGVTDGGDGGGAGQNGWSGGGGGGGSATGVRQGGPENYLAIAGAGGGGGGGSHNVSGEDGGPAGGWESRTGFVGHQGGNEGETKNGDGGGGGGGGAGAGPTRAGGGGSGQDNDRGGRGGGGGTSAFDGTQANFMGGGGGNDGDGWASLNYTGTVEVGTTVTKNTIITGSNTSKLTLSCDTVGIQTVQCRVSSPEATNTPVLSDEVTFSTVSIVNDYPINVEAIGIIDSATVSGVDLSNGEYTFYSTGNDPDASSITNLYSFYSPDKDINVEMDMYGGKIGDNGGEGGYSRIRFTMEQNVEYVLTGLNSPIDAPFLYRKGTLIAVVAAGGHAGVDGSTGGDGGGIQVAGEDGKGSDGGAGPKNPSTVVEGQLGIDGVFGSAYISPTLYPADEQQLGLTGGKSIRCTKGVYFAEQGVGACADIGTSQFRLSDGIVVSNTASITRGFKDGYNIMQTGSKGQAATETTQHGDGGVGVVGGNGAQGPRGGGGGGSGYTDGSVEVVATQLGGSTGAAKCILRVVT